MVEVLEGVSLRDYLQESEEAWLYFWQGSPCEDTGASGRVRRGEEKTPMPIYERIKQGTIEQLRDKRNTHRPTIIQMYLEHPVPR